MSNGNRRNMLDYYAVVMVLYIYLLCYRWKLWNRISEEQTKCGCGGRREFLDPAWSTGRSVSGGSGRERRERGARREHGMDPCLEGVERERRDSGASREHGMDSCLEGVERGEISEPAGSTGWIRVSIHTLSVSRQLSLRWMLACTQTNTSCDCTARWLCIHTCKHLCAQMEYCFSPSPTPPPYSPLTPPSHAVNVILASSLRSIKVPRSQCFCIFMWVCNSVVS